MAKTTHGVEAPEPGAQLNFASMWKMPPGFRRRRSAVALASLARSRVRVNELGRGVGRERTGTSGVTTRGDDPDQSMVDEAGTFAYPDFGRSPIIGVFWPDTI
jgi:hypothetical protein